MSGADSDDDRVDELIERYRAASAADPTRPSDSVRQSIFSHARIVAATHATRGMRTAPTRRPAANYSSWRISAAASVIVAAFATVLAWHLHAPMPPSAQEPNPAPSNAAALHQPEAGSTASSAPPEPLPGDRGAGTDLAPNAVTTRSRQPPVARADSPAENAAAEGSAMGMERGLENQTATAQVAASPDAAPPNVEARRSPALSADASARTRAAPTPVLVTAAESGNLERVDQLLRSEITTEQTDARGRTALLVATLRGDMPMVRRLLAAGARADAVDEDGDTPLAAARRQGPPELAHLLERATHP